MNKTLFQPKKSHWNTQEFCIMGIKHINMGRYFSSPCCFLRRKRLVPANCFMKMHIQAQKATGRDEIRIKWDKETLQKV